MVDIARDPPPSPGEQWWHYAKSNVSPTPVSPEAHAYAGVTDAVEQGTKGFDKFFKERAEDLGTQVGEEESSKFGLATEVNWENTTGKEVMGSPPKDTLVPPTDDAAKKQVDAGLKGVDSIVAAKNQGGTPGHVRETDYLASLYKRASQLRSQWPGYRDYIDRGIEKATGITPNANAYIKSMLSDINDVLSKKNSTDQHIDTKLIDAAANGNRIAMDAYHLKQAGMYTGEQALQRLTTSQVPKYESERAEQQFKGLEANSKTAQNYVMRDIRNTLTSNTNQAVQTFFDGLGLTDDKWTDLAKGKLTWQDLGKDPRLLKSSLDNLRTLIQKQNDQYLDSPITIGGQKTTRRVAAAEQLDPEIKNSYRILDMLDHQLINPDGGMINHIKNAVSDANLGAQWNVWSGATGTSDMLRGLKMANEFGGGQFTAAMVSQAGWDTRNLSVESIAAAIGDTAGGFKTKGLDGMKQTLDTFNSETHGETNVPLNVYLRTLSQALRSDDVKDPAKINIAKHMFDTKDLGWMGLLKETPDTAGRHSMFLRLTDPDIVKAIRTLDQRNPSFELGKKYDNWIKYTFGQDLFNHDIQDLNGLGNRAGVKFEWHTPPGQAPFFRASPNPGDFPLEGTILPGQAQSRSDKVNQVIGKLNDGIKAMYNVYKDAAPGKVMEEFKNQGFNLGKPESMANGLVWAMAQKSAPNAGSTKSQGRAETATAPSFSNPIMASPPPSQVFGTPTISSTPQGGGITQEMNVARRPWPFTGEENTHHWQKLMEQTGATAAELAGGFKKAFGETMPAMNKAGEAYSKGFEKFKGKVFGEKEPAETK